MGGQRAGPAVVKASAGFVVPIVYSPIAPITPSGEYVMDRRNLLASLVAIPMWLIGKKPHQTSDQHPQTIYNLAMEHKERADLAEEKLAVLSAEHERVLIQLKRVMATNDFLETCNRNHLYSLLRLQGYNVKDNA